MYKRDILCDAKKYFNGENESSTDLNENHISCEEHLIICLKKSVRLIIYVGNFSIWNVKIFILFIIQSHFTFSCTQYV
jgi:hypothetical protein